MDSDNDEIPVIMGILGNNVQTPLNTQTPSKDPKVTNNTPGSLATSGFAQSVDPPEAASTPSPPDRDLITDKPKEPDAQSEAAALNPPPYIVLIVRGVTALPPNIYLNFPARLNI